MDSVYICLLNMCTKTQVFAHTQGGPMPGQPSSVSLVFTNGVAQVQSRPGPGQCPESEVSPMNDQATYIIGKPRT